MLVKEISISLFVKAMECKLGNQLCSKAYSNGPPLGNAAVFDVAIGDSPQHLNTNIPIVLLQD